MRQLVRVSLTGAFVWVLLALSPYAISSAHAQAEFILNSHKIQVVHNTGTNQDVLNMTLDVTGVGPDCEEADDLLESGVFFAVAPGACGVSGSFPFTFNVSPYVEHEIGNTSYGTFFAVNGAGVVASKITTLATPDYTCGRWSINVQATGLNLSSLVALNPIALYLDDSDNDAANDAGSGSVCFDISDAQVGSGIVKPHQGLHRLRHASR